MQVRRCVHIESQGRDVDLVQLDRAGAKVLLTRVWAESRTENASLGCREQGGSCAFQVSHETCSVLRSRGKCQGELLGAQRGKVRAQRRGREIRPPPVRLRGSQCERAVEITIDPVGNGCCAELPEPGRKRGVVGNREHRRDQGGLQRRVRSVHGEGHHQVATHGVTKVTQSRLGNRGTLDGKQHCEAAVLRWV